MISFVAAFGESLHLVARNHALLTECDLHGCSLPAPLHIFDHRIMCFDLRGLHIKVGDWLVATGGVGGGRCGRIDEIQINKTAVPFVDGTTMAVQVGIRTDMHAKDGWAWRLVTE